MKRVFIFSLLFALVACGESEEQTEKLAFEKYEHELSFALGAGEGKRILETPGFNGTQLNKAFLVKGFKGNFSENEPTGCDVSLNNLYGPAGTDFNTDFLDAGSECVGKITAYGFFREISQVDKISQIDTMFLFKGFESALNGEDTVQLSEENQNAVLREFFEGINAKVQQEIAMKEEGIWAEVKAKENVKEVEAGVWIETVKAGKGGSPKEGDDVQADYILTSLTGDTIQNSFDRLKSGQDVPAPAFNLNAVYEGWRVAFPHLKKGGQYRIYLPYSAVLDQRLPQQSYIFYVDFIDFGAANSLVKNM
jgi:FKBP-type peptidyl-prolyl cis-trans isomerase